MHKLTTGQSVNGGTKNKWIISIMLCLPKLRNPCRKGVRARSQRWLECLLDKPLMNSQQLQLPTQDQASQHSSMERRANESQPLTEELLTDNGFWKRKS